MYTLYEYIMFLSWFLQNLLKEKIKKEKKVI